MIKVDNVSMKFNLGIEKNFSLKLFFINLFKPKSKNYQRYNQRQKTKYNSQFFILNYFL